jgi:phosphate transport system substrate-binding protein
MKEALRGLAESQQSYSKELSALVDAFPVYSPSANKWTGTIKVTGSSTMGPLLTNLALGFESMHGTLDIVVRQGGTDGGLKALGSGACDVAAVSRALTAEERTDLEAGGRRAVEVTIALDGVCVFVNRDNPLQGLTRQQCNGVFSIEHTMVPMPIYRWNQLDAGSPLGDEFLRLHIPNDQSGTLKLFREWCMPGEEFTTSTRYVEPGPSSVVNACCAYPLAIGIAGYGNLQPRARALPIAADAAGPFVEPSVDTIRRHAYPLWRPLNVVWLAKPGEPSNPAITDWMRYILSETGQDLVATVGFVPPHMDQVPAEVGVVDGDAWRR